MRVGALVVAFGLLAAACGGGNDEGSGASGGGGGDQAEAKKVGVVYDIGGRGQAERHQQGGHPHTPYPTHALAPLGLQAPTCASTAGWRYLTTPRSVQGPRREAA